MAGDDGSSLALRVTGWLFTHPHAETSGIMREFHLSWAEALAVIPQVHAIMDALMEQYPDPKDFADHIFDLLVQSERSAGDGG
jgi:hypothetical protein